MIDLPNIEKAKGNYMGVRLSRFIYKGFSKNEFFGAENVERRRQVDSREELRNFGWRKK